MRNTTFARRAAALALGLVLGVSAPLGLAAQAAAPQTAAAGLEQPAAPEEPDEAAAPQETDGQAAPETMDHAGGDTIGGANTAQVPTGELRLDIEDEETNGWLSSLFGGNDTITVRYLNVKGQGLRSNVRLSVLDCLVGITYTELGSIAGYVNAGAAAEAWRAQAIAIHSYLEYQNKFGSSANALTYTPVDQIPSSARQAMYNAISPVQNYLLVYGSGSRPSDYQVCDAVFSCSGGYNTQTGVYGTCAGKDAWGVETPYLQSVESKYERKYHEVLQRSIGSSYTYLEYNDSRHPGEPYFSADTTHKSLGGYVLYNTLESNGRHYTYINQFASSRYCFDFGQDADGVNVMTYYGLGHGVGMSQCGAVGYAVEEGYTYRKILQKYYTGAALLDTSRQSVESMDGAELAAGSGSASGAGFGAVTQMLQNWWRSLLRLFGLA